MARWSWRSLVHRSGVPGCGADEIRRDAVGEAYRYAKPRSHSGATFQKSVPESRSGTDTSLLAMLMTACPRARA
jgi:hypothetical protein